MSDRLGSVRDLVSTSRAVLNHVVYDAFGRIKSETNAANGDRFKYTGRETDAVTGLQSNRARYYDAVIGRWTQEDPIGYEAGDANLYRYVGNGPTNAADPSGLLGDPYDKKLQPQRPPRPARPPRIQTGGPSDVPDTLPGRWKVGVFADPGHSWIRYECISDPTGNHKPGEVHTAGRYPSGRGGRIDPSTGEYIVPPAAVPGVQWDLDKKREDGLYDSLQAGTVAGRYVILDDPTVFKDSDGGFGYSLGYNNCTTYAARAWRFYSGEWLDPRPGPFDNPLPDWPFWLMNSIKEANKPPTPFDFGSWYEGMGNMGAPLGR